MKTLSILVAAIAVAAALSVVLSRAMANPAEAPALTVSLAEPVLREWPETVPAGGWLVPWQEATIASETGGLRITEILVDVGSVVTKGQPLVRLFDKGVVADITRQEAAVRTATANLAKAKADADRARQLRPSGALSDQAITERLTNEETAKASLVAEEAALEVQKIRLAQTTITAVDDGLVISRSAQLGAVVSPGTELFRIIRQQRIEWRAEVSARYLPRISEGLNAKIDFADRRLIHGKVRLVGPSVSTETGRAIIYVDLPADAGVRSGVYVTGNIELQKTPALTVPDTAIVFRDGLNYVFTVGTDKRARRILVGTGRRNNGEVEITSGIDGSAKVVTSGGAFLSENVLVNIAEQS